LRYHPKTLKFGYAFGHFKGQGFVPISAVRKEVHGMRKLIPAMIVVALLTVSTYVSLAESSVQIFFVTCDTKSVLNVSGNMDAGFDVFYQVFSGSGGTGTAITSLRQVQVDAAYAVSDQVSYNAGATIATGATASVKVFIARESGPTASNTPFVVDDIQDGCNNPQNPLTTSLDAGAGGTTTTTTTTTAGSNILSPFGGVINPGITITPQPIVVIGARTVINQERSATPGVIFAECNQFLPGAAPGLLYDNDNIVIFWSWFAKTAEQVQDHISNAIYDVTLSGEPLKEVNVSPISEQDDGNLWVFYTANIGHLRQGQYGINFRLTWEQAITDGYADYGPGTANTETFSNCTFFIQRNPDNEAVTDFNAMYSLND
jgi:hypothetical protein